MDLAIVWDAARFRGDWAVTAGDLATGNDLWSAVLVSLFTDRAAPQGYVPTDGTQDRRGWWADTYEAEPIGSLLWTLNRAVKSDGAALLNQVADMCVDALRWLRTAGVVAGITVQAAWLTRQAIGIGVTITEPNGAVRRATFPYVWQGADAAAGSAPGPAYLATEGGVLLTDDAGVPFGIEGIGVIRG